MISFIVPFLHFFLVFVDLPQVRGEQGDRK